MPRKLERKELSKTILIDDVINQRPFGELVNLTLDGMMVMSDQELPTHAIYQLSLKLPVELAGSDHIAVGADCLWTKRAEHFNRYWAGLQIIDASDQAMAQLAELIEHYGK